MMQYQVQTVQYSINYSKTELKKKIKCWKVILIREYIFLKTIMDSIAQENKKPNGSIRFLFYKSQTN